MPFRRGVGVEEDFLKRGRGEHIRIPLCDQVINRRVSPQGVTSFRILATDLQTLLFLIHASFLPPRFTFSQSNEDAVFMTRKWLTTAMKITGQHETGSSRYGRKGREPIKKTQECRVNALVAEVIPVCPDVEGHSLCVCFSWGPSSMVIFKYWNPSRMGSGLSACSLSQFLELADYFAALSEVEEIDIEELSRYFYQCGWIFAKAGWSNTSRFYEPSWRGRIESSSTLLSALSF